MTSPHDINGAQPASPSADVVLGERAAGLSPTPQPSSIRQKLALAAWRLLVIPVGDFSSFLGRFGDAVSTTIVAEAFRCDAAATSRLWTVPWLRRLHQRAHTGSACHAQPPHGAPE